ncbi:hypothetical protein MKY95_19440 [Paenibacillus sp. FSL P4-0176]|uniref:hypothetical protein n=1 Tax=Paenibacillus sp. FSL P4-0176 TaxID=2921631 RepID=UPI0030D3DC27
MRLLKRENFLIVVAVIFVGYTFVFFRDTESSAYAASGVLTTIAQKGTEWFTFAATKLQSLFN